MAKKGETGVEWRSFKAGRLKPGKNEGAAKLPWARGKEHGERESVRVIARVTEREWKGRGGEE
jgi:hypothetical protein